MIIDRFKATAPQASNADIEEKKDNNDFEVESLVRILSEHSERLALLEHGRTSSTTEEASAAVDDTTAAGFDAYNIKKNNTHTETSMNDRIAAIEKWKEDREDSKDIQLNDEGEFDLADSTFSLLITQHPLSIPFIFGVCSVALSISCLSLTLASSLNKGTRGNVLGIPAGVDGAVRAAQFLGAFVGVIFEDEIPQGLQLLANAAGHTLLLNGQKDVQKSVIISSIFRLVVGYLFLSSLFINIAQNADVIEIFYDVLALEFVENIDDTTFALAKRGFFGRTMLFATNQKYKVEISEVRRSPSAHLQTGDRDTLDSERRLSFSGLIASNSRCNYLVKSIYFMNATIFLIGLGYITRTQQSGEYRTRLIRVLFGEEIWENANVVLNERINQRLLIYSYFNGIYKENGTYDGYPRYVEQSKNNSTILGIAGKATHSGFGPSSMPVPGAELIYCDEIGSWVFRHPNILTSYDGIEENECSWLWRSFQTDDYDILSTDEGAWEAWIGEIKPLVQISITSIECSERSDCNYHGECREGVCYCDALHSGDSYEFELPCPALASEKAHTIDPIKGLQWKQENPIREVVGHSVYNRPLYIQTGLSGEPYDMRLYKILESDRSDSPSTQPSSKPSTQPSSIPTGRPSLVPSSKPSTSNRPTISTHPTTRPSVSARPTHTAAPSKLNKVGSRDESKTDKSPIPTESPTKHLYKQNEYDEAPDFADVDDFFERQSIHDLEKILQNYSVVLSYTGSRFYGTIIASNASLDVLFPPNYHAFWDISFNIDRTFIISDTTFSSTLVGVDFFEMRRRVNNLLNPNIQFSYGPYGALIPLMNYDGTGFFHCLDDTPSPSTEPSTTLVPTTSFSPSHIPSKKPSISTHPTISSSPTSSSAPTTTTSPSSSPTEKCWTVNIDIVHDSYPDEISWVITRIDSSSASELEGIRMLTASNDYFTRIDSSSASESEGIRMLATASNDYGNFYHAATLSFDVLENDVGSNLYVKSITSQGSQGICSVASNELLVIYAPYEPTFVGFDQCTYEVCGDMGDCDKAVVGINIEGNDDGLVVDDYYDDDDDFFAVSGTIVARGRAVDKICLQEGVYEFLIRDTAKDGIFDPGYYSLVSDGIEIKRGGGESGFDAEERTGFTIPLRSESPPSCEDTPGFVDLYGDDCEYYAYEANYPQACEAFGNSSNGENGMTPNDNCCVCKELLDN